MENPPAPLVSVVLPVWNSAASIARAVASIRQQTFGAWELLVIDDGSSDSTPAILAAETAIDARIRVLTQPHFGLVAALNAGIAAARGELIARMDADDESHPERLAEQAALLQSRPELGVAGCLVEFGGDRRVSAGYARHVDWMNSLVTAEAMALNRFVESPLAHPGVMFRRELVARHGGYRAGDFPEDDELWLRWLDAGVPMAKVPRVLLRWNDPPGRLSRTDLRYAAEAFFRIKARWIARWLAAAGVITEESCAGRRSAPPGGLARPIYVWGAGRPTRKRAGLLAPHGVRIAGYIDVDPKKLTRAIGGTGLPVIAPAELPAPGAIFVLGYVTSRGARDLIRDELGSRGYLPGRDFLLCA